MSRYPMSDAWHVRALQRTPMGSQTMSKCRSRYGSAHPAFLSAGNGAWVRDLDGHEYCDWSLGLAAITLGYRHRHVDDAVRMQLENGVSFSLPTMLEAMVAEELCEIFPCGGEQGSVRFVKTGSEADSAACRIARRATGRMEIYACGYLGWHDWALSRNDDHPGIAHWDDHYVMGFEYNDLESIEKDLLGDVAAIFIEPVLFEQPKLGFLEGLRTLCDQHGCLLIFDEVVYGGRWALGGAQEYFGVTPDLCTFGKGLANGYPLAGIIGHRDLMQYADTISGTFGGEALSLAACQATLEVYQEEKVIEHMWSIGARLLHGICLPDYNLPCIVEGYPVHPRIRFTGEHANECMTLLLQELARYGVLIHPGGWNVSLAHGEKEIEHTVRAFDIAFEVIQAALKEGFEKYLKGSLIEPSPFQRSAS